PAKVDATVDSFEVNVELKNLGRGTNDTFAVKLIREFPNSDTSQYIKNVDGTSFKKTVSFKLPSRHDIANGVNKFDIRVDLPLNFIDEQYDEANNNQINDATLLIQSGGIFPIYPDKFAIWPDSSVILKASTGDAFAKKKNYIFELDTTDLFNSPIKKTKIKSSAGGVVEWNPNISLQDSTVYFWRVSEDKANKEWRESTFEYIDKKRGWGQSHFFQLKDNNFNLMEIFHRYAPSDYQNIWKCQ
ncbi:MAG: hypothetical protein ABEH43_07985, partial [Flavobacteriales bacterium]